MPTPRFLWKVSAFDGATLTTNSEASGLPATNLQNAIVRRPWRTAGITQQTWVVFDLGTATLVNCAGIFGHNLRSTAAITLQGNASDSWGAPTFNVALTLITDPDGIVHEKAMTLAQGTFRYWRLAIQDPSSVNTYWEIGRLMAGNAYTPAVPYTLEDPSRMQLDPSILDIAEGQQAYARLRTQYSRYRVRFENLERTDQDAFLALFRHRGNVQPLMVVVDPTDAHTTPRDTLYGRITTPLQWVLTNMVYGTVDLELEEVW